jgi:hypothetical protein
VRDIAKLLSGLFAPGESDEFRLAEQARRAGEWCGSTPRRGAVADALRGAGGGRGGAARPRGTGGSGRRGR